MLTPRMRLHVSSTFHPTEKTHISGVSATDQHKMSTSTPWKQLSGLARTQTGAFILRSFTPWASIQFRFIFTMKRVPVKSTWGDKIWPFRAASGLARSTTVRVSTWKCQTVYNTNLNTPSSFRLTLADKMWTRSLATSTATLTFGSAA